MILAAKTRFAKRGFREVFHQRQSLKTVSADRSMCQSVIKIGVLFYSIELKRIKNFRYLFAKFRYLFPNYERAKSLRHATSKLKTNILPLQVTKIKKCAPFYKQLQGKQGHLRIHRKPPCTQEVHALLFILLR